MKTNQLLTRSILHYWRTNLAVLLGVVAGTAVIAGALIVGDSVRYSLRKMTLDRLGNIDYVLNSHRFFREETANELSELDEFQGSASSFAPALVMTGAIERRIGDDPNGDGEQQTVLRAGQVNIYGVDDKLWNMTETGDVSVPDGTSIVLNSRVADELSKDQPERIKAGDTVTAWVEIPSTIPRDSLLGHRDETSTEIELTVAAILDESSGVGRLQLNPNQQLPLTAFVSLKQLQSSINLGQKRTSRRAPTVLPARINTVFVSGEDNNFDSKDVAESVSTQLNAAFKKVLKLEDLNLRIRTPDNWGDKGYESLESDQMILEETIADRAQEVALELNQSVSPVLVHLANEISNPTDPAKYSRYSIVAGIDFQAEGPFKYVGDAPKLPLGAHGIVINQKLADDLDVEVGQPIKMDYFLVGKGGELNDADRTFVVRGIVEMSGTAIDRDLTPLVKGITDVDNFRDWNAPFPMKKVTESDDDYWDEYKATPKSFVDLEVAQELWSTRYGKLTSLRVSPWNSNAKAMEIYDTFTEKFLSSLNPDELGLAFQPVKYNGLKAASGTTDFSGLFIGFSFFLILSATILISLLFRLGIERRGSNIGLLAAVGFAPAQVRKLFLTEGLAVVVTGGLIGLAAAIGYASLMVYGLKNWWYGAIQTKFLYVSVQPLTLVIGFSISVAIAIGVIWWALRQLRGISTRALLSGVTEAELTVEAQQLRGRKARKIAAFSFVAAIILYLGAEFGLNPSNQAFSGFSLQAVTFFLVGTLMLTASLTSLSAWLDSDRTAAVRGAGLMGTGRLGLRNAARNRRRSVLSTGLIASAAFVIVAVAAGQRNPAVETPDKSSGNGGFWLVGKSSTPVFPDLNLEQGRDEQGFFIQDPQDAKLLERMLVMRFRVKPGEEASCLNIYQTELPTVLGVPDEMIERGGFKFVGADRKNPWTILEGKNQDGSIPVLGDMNTLMYSLKKKVGATISIPDDKKPDYTLKIAGMFDSSIFQGVLLMSEENFDDLYREQAGYQYFLIGDRNEGEAAMTPDEVQRLSRLLETQLAPVGFDTERVADRLASFLAVQNTYLSTFQTLGGLGLLLGTLGLATVMLRNVLERRSELALLRAVGFNNGGVAWLVICENAFLLVWGLAAGTASALLAMLAHLRTTGADVPWGMGAAVLGAVFVVGMCAALLAVKEAVRTPIVVTLRSE